MGQPSQISWDIVPTEPQVYTKAFEFVKGHIQRGDTYLLNLAFPSRLQTHSTLEDIYHQAVAPYKVYAQDAFVIFSPESFVQIRDGYIYAYPMKGTIEAHIPGAEKKLLENEKELWEHNTIVDLIRNDLSIVSEEVEIQRFRYVERIRTQGKDILQTSSEIRGKLPANWKEQLGEILLKLLPAGSISGAPKQKTVEIIEAAEITPRNYYTGIFGLFDGEQLDSAVSIRFVEKIADHLYYKSGGGITFMSKKEEEYQELIDKIYVPTV